MKLRLNGKDPFMPVNVFLVILLFLTTSTFAQRKEEFRSYFRISGVPYTDSKNVKANQMDVYMPKKGSMSPVVIWIHNGYWTSGDKSDVDSKPEFFTSKGYIFISLNHRLSPEVSYIQQIQDVAVAITWIHKNIIHYSGDKEKLFLMGYGTGAHLATHIMVQEKYLSSLSASRKMIKGVVTMEGAGFDIPAVYEVQSNKFREGCEEAIGKSKRLWINASPVNYVTPDSTIPPFMITYAGSDTPSEAEAKSLSLKLTKANIKNKMVGYSRKNSNSINRDLGKEGDKTGDEILTFFYECLRLSE